MASRRCNRGETDMTGIVLSYRVSPEILGAAQRLACRSRPKDRLSRFLFLFTVVCVIFDLFVPGATAAYWPFLVLAGVGAYFASLFWYMRRLRRAITEEWGEVSLLVEEDGLRITERMRVESLYFWPVIREIREIPTKKNAWVSILLDSAQGLVLPVPFSAFADAAARQAFIAAVKAGIEKAKETKGLKMKE